MTEGGGEGGAVDVHFPNEASEWPTREHLVYLYLASTDAPLTIADLQDRTPYSTRTVIRAVNGLVERGRAIRERDADDPRRTLVRHRERDT
jgi:DNA-binding MarR family transcriptional regulator